MFLLTQIPRHQQIFTFSRQDSGMRQPGLHFKHIYGPNPYEWGFFGFPKQQSPSSAFRRYQTGDLILLAVTKNPPMPPEVWQGYEGRIVGLCTVPQSAAPSRKLANPGLSQKYPDVISAWPQGALIAQYWHVQPMPEYESFAQEKLVHLAAGQRGKMFPLEDHNDLVVDLWSWLSIAEVREEKRIYRSAEALRLLNQMPQERMAYFDDGGTLQSA